MDPGRKSYTANFNKNLNATVQSSFVKVSSKIGALFEIIRLKTFVKFDVITPKGGANGAHLCDIAPQGNTGEA